MELRRLRNLIKIPDLAELPNLETFDLCVCPRLKEIYPSIGRLEKLLFLCIEDCPRLRMFPSITRIMKLETLAFSYCGKLEIISDMGNLPHNNMNHRALRILHSTLRKLDLTRCSLGDEVIGSDFWVLPNLEELNLIGNPFSQLDFSILQLPRLKWLNVSHCYSLVELSQLPSSIVVVSAD